MKKLSYLFAVAASAACLCACTDVTDALRQNKSRPMHVVPWGPM